MKLTLSTEKTLITDVRKKHIHFLGCEYKVVPGKARNGYICRTLPDRKRLKRKVDEIADDIKSIPTNASREQVIHRINLINSKIRGLVNYYDTCTWVYPAMKKHFRRLQFAAFRRFKQYKGKWIPANETQNLSHIHEKYKQKIASVKYRDIWIGITSLTFCKWEKPQGKNQDETPFTENGRQLYFKRTKKKRQLARMDEMLTEKVSDVASMEAKGKLYNFEFYMNRAYALNRDRLKCRVCGGWLIDNAPYTHRIDPKLPLNKVNKVNNLASMHKRCFELVNNVNASISYLETKTRRKIESFRERLVKTHVKTNA